MQPFTGFIDKQLHKVYSILTCFQTRCSVPLDEKTSMPWRMKMGASPNATFNWSILEKPRYFYLERYVFKRSQGRFNILIFLSLFVSTLAAFFSYCTSLLFHFCVPVMMHQESLCTVPSPLHIKWTHHPPNAEAPEYLFRSLKNCVISRRELFWHELPVEKRSLSSQTSNFQGSIELHQTNHVGKQGYYGVLSRKRRISNVTSFDS